MSLKGGIRKWYRKLRGLVLIPDKRKGKYREGIGEAMGKQSEDIGKALQRHRKCIQKIEKAW